MKLLELPSEILCEIIGLCGPGVVTEICRTFADIAVSTPALWTSVHLGPLQSVPEGREYLSRRISRTADSLLTVSVELVEDQRAKSLDLSILVDLLVTLSDWSTQISHLQVHVDTTYDASFSLLTIFHGLTTSVVCSALQSLSVRVKFNYSAYSRYYTDSVVPPLPSVLAGSHKHFPCLQFLPIPAFYDCMPSFPENATFSHLHTLVLDGAREESYTNICLVTELLSNTPQLETLWLKHDLRCPDNAALNPVPSWEKYKPGVNPLRVFLPHLVRLAVAAPGTGTDLPYCLEAPSLADLHLDGSGPYRTEWGDDCRASVQGALRSFASRSSGLRRLAFTQASLDRSGFGWLFFGNGNRPPFPWLETLAFHGYRCPFDLHDELLLRFARQPTMPLRRLVFLQNGLSFHVSAFVQMYRKVIANAPNKKYELEIYCSCAQITEDDLYTLEGIGVQLTRCYAEEKMMEWRTFGYKIDASDSHVY